MPHYFRIAVDSQQRKQTSFYVRSIPRQVWTEGVAAVAELAAIYMRPKFDEGRRRGHCLDQTSEKLADLEKFRATVL